MKAIVVTGTPGAGKTTLSKALCKQLNLEYMDVPVGRVKGGYDRKRKCAIVDVNKLNRVLIRHISAAKKIPVIDSHMSHFLPAKYVALCIVCTCNLKELKRRLEKKGYSQAKVRENLDCEIFETSLVEARENNHSILVLNTTRGIDEKSINKVKKALKQVQVRT
jgi:adenylate kinase